MLVRGAKDLGLQPSPQLEAQRSIVSHDVLTAFEVCALGKMFPKAHSTTKYPGMDLRRLHQRESRRDLPLPLWQWLPPGCLDARMHRLRDASPCQGTSCGAMMPGAQAHAILQSQASGHANEASVFSWYLQTVQGLEVQGIADPEAAMDEPFYLLYKDSGKNCGVQRNDRGS